MLFFYLTKIIFIFNLYCVDVAFYSFQEIFFYLRNKRNNVAFYSLTLRRHCVLDIFFYNLIYTHSYSTLTFTICSVICMT